MTGGEAKMGQVCDYELAEGSLDVLYENEVQGSVEIWAQKDDMSTQA